MNLQIIDPTTFPHWDDLLLSTPGYSFFHSSAWARVLKESYGYTPMYFASIKNDHFSALIPVMEVNSYITGKRGVSLPFTDYCEPVVDEDISFQDLFKQISDLGKRRGWKYLELRGGDKFFNPQSAIRNPQSEGPTLCTLYPSPCSYATYFGHTLDLTGGEEKILSGLRESTKRNIKKAQKGGVEVKIVSSLDGIKEFCRLNCLTRRKHGLPPQPYHFFRKVYEHIISRGLGYVSLASHNGQNIAGGVFFHFGDKTVYKYGASDMKFQDLRANNLSMWEGIRWFCNNGYKTFCFGRTEPENRGLQQFKAGWGTEEQSIQYFKYDLIQGTFVSNMKNPESGTRSILLNRLAQRTPIPVLNLAGSLLYRHMG